MGIYIGHRLVARPETNNTFWNDIILSVQKVLSGSGRTTRLRLREILKHSSTVNPQVRYLEKKERKKVFAE